MVDLLASMAFAPASSVSPGSEASPGVPIVAGVPSGQHNVVTRKAADPFSPYYIPPVDYPGINICGFTLTGPSTYRDWVYAVEDAFRAKRKLGFLDGSITKPTDPLDLEDWVSVNSMMNTWLRMTVDAKIRPSLGRHPSVRDLWLEIKKRFSVINSLRIQELVEAIATCRQGSDMVDQYYGRLKILWDEYDCHRFKLSCSCEHCLVTVLPELQAGVEEAKAREFIMGLNTRLYGHIRTNILSTSPLPPLLDIYQVVQQEETHLDITRRSETITESLACAVTYPQSRPQANTDKSKLQCTFCGQKGHDIRMCFQQTGKYPDWYLARGRGRGRSSSGGQPVSTVGSSGGGRDRSHTRGSAFSADSEILTTPGASTVSSTPGSSALISTSSPSFSQAAHATLVSSVSGPDFILPSAPPGFIHHVPSTNYSLGGPNVSSVPVTSSLPHLSPDQWASVFAMLGISNGGSSTIGSEHLIGPSLEDTDWPR